MAAHSKQTENKKGNYWVTGAVFLAVILLFTYLEMRYTFRDKRAVENAYLNVHYIDVGQGDSALVRAGDHYMLIDAGESNGRAYTYLNSLNMEKLDYVIATHPHSDHIGAMSKIIDSYEIDNFIMPDVVHDTKAFENMIESLEQNDIQVMKAQAGEQFYLGEALVEVFAPNSEEYENLNNYSVVLKLTYKNHSFLFTGDAEYQSEVEMVDAGFDLQSDFLKVGHHGSNTSTSDEFLDAVNPEVAVISLGEGNSYGHPHDELMQKLDEKGIAIYRTDSAGNIIIGSDGEEYFIFEKVVN